MGSEYPTWHPLHSVSEVRNECQCGPKGRTIGVEMVAGSAAYICQECDGYVD